MTIVYCNFCGFNWQHAGYHRDCPKCKKEKEIMYPEDWPKCKFCNAPAMDGHLTCGSAGCSESEARANGSVLYLVKTKEDALKMSEERFAPNKKK